MILVTGANGLLGSFVCRKLLAEKVAFKALVRNSSDLSLIADIMEEIELVEANILDVVTLEKHIKEIDEVIHTAAMVSYNKADISMMRKVNIEGTRNLIDLCVKYKVKKFVHTSSIAAIGRFKHNAAITEETKWQASPMNTEYGKSKNLSEMEAWRGCGEGLKVVVVNPSVILGPGDWEKSSAKIFKYVWDGNRFYTHGNLNVVDVRDVANIIFLLLKAGFSGERYIINAFKLSNKKLLDQIAIGLGTSSPNIKLGKGLMKILVAVEHIKSMVTRKRPLITAETARVSATDYSYDNTKIINTLNYRFYSVEETIKWTCSVFKSRIEIL